MTAQQVLRQLLKVGGRVIPDPARPRIVVPPALKAIVLAHRQELRALILDRRNETLSAESAPPGGDQTKIACQRSTAGPWRVTVLRRTAVAAPVQLNGWTKILDPTICAQATLADLEIAVAHKNGGRNTVFTQLIEEYIETLAACGVEVSVDVVS